MKGKTLKQITNTPKAGLKELPALPNNEDFNIEVTSKESGKKYTVSTNILGSGGLESVIAGDNITIDDTDPLNPIISATGGGSSTLFPNGYNFITGNYTLQASDEGKLIISLAETPVHITVPTGSDVFTNKIIGIAMISPGDFEIEPGVAVTQLHQTNDGLGIGDLKCETVICQTFAADGINGLNVLSTSVINDNGFYKTMLCYLYDNQGGGGSPAGSDNQIQINQSGAFFADSTFQKSTSGFNVGLDHTQQSAVTFTGSGLDDLTLSGTFSGTYPTTYTVTIDGINKDFVNFPTSSISGSGFQIGETVTSTSGGSATIDAVNQNSTGSYENLVLSGITGTFLQFDTITGSTSGTTATLDADLLQQDTYTWTDGTTTVSNVICKTFGSTLISNNVLLNFDTGTSHTLSDSWTWTYSNVNQNVLDFSNNDYKFQSTFGTDTFGVSLKGDIVSLGNLSGGNNTKITIDDVNEHITISNLPAYDDDTAAGVGGLTAGMVYMTTGSGSAPLNAAGILMIKQ